MRRLHLWEALYTLFQQQWIPGDRDIKENPHRHIGTGVMPDSHLGNKSNIFHHNHENN